MLPNFLIVGSIKSATTSIYDYLREQESIFMPDIKENRFFSNMPVFLGGTEEPQNNRIRDVESYLSLFEDNKSRLCGECSNDYLYYAKTSIETIKQVYKKYNQDLPKIIIIHRNPFDQAKSLYFQLKSLYNIDLSIKEFFDKEKYFRENSYPWTFQLKNVCLKYNSTKMYQENFDTLVLFYDDIDSTLFLKSIHDYLDIPYLENHKLLVNSNKTFYSKYRFIVKLYSFANILNLKYRMYIPKVLTKTVQKIFFFFCQKKPNSVLFPQDIKTAFNYDIESLENLLDEDLGHWKK